MTEEPATKSSIYTCSEAGITKLEEATPELRFERRNNNMHWTIVLQQKWSIRSGDTHHYEWRDVPTVDQSS